MAKKRKKKKRDDSGGGFAEHLMDFSLSDQAKRSIFIISLFLCTILSFLSLFNLAGNLGVFLTGGFSLVLGVLGFFIPVYLLVLLIVSLFHERLQVKGVTYFGAILFILALSALFLMGLTPDELLLAGTTGQGGGLVGLVLAYPFVVLMGKTASVIMLICLFLISLVLTFEQSILSLFHLHSLKELAEDCIDRIFLRHSKDEVSSEDLDIDDDFEEDDDLDDEEDIPLIADEDETDKVAAVADIVPIAPSKKYSTKRKNTFTLPVSLLNDIREQPTSGDIRENKEIIQNCLLNFSIDIEMGPTNVGPTVTQYTMKPAEGVKLSRILALQNDLSLALAAYPIRIEAPIPGKSLIGIEVPNKNVARVGLRELIVSKEVKQRSSDLTLGFGRSVNGDVYVGDLSKMPHLLVAGATGSGKSVFLNTAILSLMYQNTPETLRFVFVDPKRVELMMYNHIPFLLTPVITDVKKTVNTLKWLLGEMDRRYDTLSKIGQKNIQGYNEVNEDKMPYIVVVIDELADLMVTASAEVESSIIRLAQMARAIGIHLILATQRPSVDVITGLIKANIPARVAFAVTSLTDSRTILDVGGAEKLIGRGDMLFTSAELPKPKRLQGAFTDEPEIKRVVSYLKEEIGLPEYVSEVGERQTGSTSFDFSMDEADDDLLEDAKQTVLHAGKASASYLQRKLRIGYARAARLLDLLEEQGVIGPADGSRPREILITAEEDFEDDIDVELPDEI